MIDQREREADRSPACCDEFRADSGGGFGKTSAPLRFQVGRSKGAVEFALLTLGETKDELKAMARKCEADGFNPISGFRTAEQYFEDSMEIMYKAKLGLLCAGATVMNEEEGRS